MYCELLICFLGGISWGWGYSYNLYFWKYFWCCKLCLGVYVWCFEYLVYIFWLWCLDFSRVLFVFNFFVLFYLVVVFGWFFCFWWVLWVCLGSLCCCSLYFCVGIGCGWSGIVYYWVLVLVLYGCWVHGCCLSCFKKWSGEIG